MVYTKMLFIEDAKALFNGPNFKRSYWCNQYDLFAIGEVGSVNSITKLLMEPYDMFQTPGLTKDQLFEEEEE
jgi:hypothetical protein